MSKVSTWMVYFVNLLRPRGFSRLLSHGLLDRGNVEGGPPKIITQAFEDLFEKIAGTKVARARSHAETGWPARARTHKIGLFPAAPQLVAKFVIDVQHFPHLMTDEFSTMLVSVSLRVSVGSQHAV